jgi:hypothetical protein
MQRPATEAGAAPLVMDFLRVLAVVRQGINWRRFQRSPRPADGQKVTCDRKAQGRGNKRDAIRLTVVDLLGDTRAIQCLPPLPTMPVRRPIATKSGHHVQRKDVPWNSSDCP